MSNHIQQKYNINISGQGEQVLFFVHGYGCDQTMWRYVAPEFTDNYRVLLMDLVGAGKSDESAYHFAKYSRLSGFADDIIEVCDELGLRSVIYIGHSVAATIGVLAEIKRPDLFEKIILLTPSPCYINDEDYYGGFNRSDIEELLELLESNYLGWTSTITPVIMGNPEQPQLTQELHNRFCANNPDIATHFAKVTFLSDHREDFAKVNKDTLILQAANDVIAPDTVGEYLHRIIPQSKLHKMNAQGHCPHLSAPAETVRAIRGYLTADKALIA